MNTAQEESDLYLRRIPWWYWAVFFGALGLTFYLLGPVLTPFLISFSLAYLLHPLVDRLERHRIPRSIGVSIVFAAGVLIVVFGVLLLIPPLQTQIGRLSTFIPQATTWLQQEALPWVSRRLGTDVSRLDAGRLAQLLQDNFSQAGGIATNVATYLTSSGMKLAATLANLFLVPIVTFYMMRDWHSMLESLGKLVPRPLLPAVTDLARETDEVLAAFLRGQLLVMVALGTIYGIGFWIAGVEFAMLIGIFAGLVSFVPYLGVAMALVSAMITAASRITLKVPIRLMRITVSKTSSGCAPVLLTVRIAMPMPAQLTTICRPPNWSTAICSAAPTCSSLVTSACAKRA